LSSSQLSPADLLVLDQFGDNLEAEGLQESSIDLYSSMMRQAFKYNALDSVSRFNKFINLRRKKLSDNGFNSQIDALSSFQKHAQFLSIDLDPTLLEKIKVVCSSARISNPTLVQDRRAYTQSEIEGIENLETQEWRWHFLHIGLNFGLRSNEIRSLEFPDFDLKNKFLNVRAATTKSKKFRYIPITAAVYPVVKTRVSLKAAHQKFYLEARRGKKVSDRSAQYWINEEEQLGFKILAHNLRYTFATQLWLATHNIILIQKYLGHSSPEITWNYLKLKREDLDQEFLDLNFKVI